MTAFLNVFAEKTQQLEGKVRRSIALCAVLVAT
jgi:hypothetical protein